jgi:hypothetical protein
LHELRENAPAGVAAAVFGALPVQLAESCVHDPEQRPGEFRSGLTQMGEPVTEQRDGFDFVQCLKSGCSWLVVQRGHLADNVACGPDRDHHFPVVGGVADHLDVPGQHHDHVLGLVTLMTKVVAWGVPAARGDDFERLPFSRCEAPPETVLACLHWFRLPS